jgi:hypothetical protein
VAESELVELLYGVEGEEWPRWLGHLPWDVRAYYRRVVVEVRSARARGMEATARTNELFRTGGANEALVGRVDRSAVTSKRAALRQTVWEARAYMARSELEGLVQDVLGECEVDRP